MANPFLGEIRMFAGNFAPVGWAFCNGQLLPIADFDALFALVGTSYGGNGTTTFALPNLQSRIPVHQGSSQGNSYLMGQTAGEESVVITIATMPMHSHVAQAQSGDGNRSSPASGFWASSSLGQFSAAAPNGTMNSMSVGPVVGNQAHSNIMPYLAVNFIIALEGIFPSQS
jgi:microcystin-dependent protein